MRRTKQWWATLAKAERAELVGLEREQNHIYDSAYLPEGYSECGYCSNPTSSGGLCTYCNSRLIELIEKADRALLEERTRLAIKLYDESWGLESKDGCTA